MLHLKNITAGNPKTAEQYQMTKQYGVTWLFSEDDKNWYEEQKNFASDTIKMVYTGDGRVVWVGKDVTGIEPRNASVIEVPDITANRRITAPGYWFYRNDEFVFDYKLKAEDERDALLKQSSIMTCEWEKDLLLGLISDEDREKLKAYRIYAKSLQAMDFSTIADKTSYNAIEWPVSPEASS
ncbi:tail fiber assembly protein, partial [Escherichia coli]|uniref:tail fiber assembly protein n=1 Tax=Escherichia coli TaxID=562 RepID=UPI000DA4C6E3|nr:tail fiber assembly protein [Escherichia coli]EGN0941861.1 tail fiber assembly protein [Escherichia coli]EJW9336878.1 tail fiber assembly protein [Escherichia coli]MBA8424172.1 tail fiber assembly protein [Escherichia coli]QMD68348.1 tail fiber assembly protein [Escherichia coli]SQZ90615.1 putative tail fiber assembly protein [Escherichia coli]